MESYKLIECTNNRDLPKGALRCYVAKTLEEALALHLRHGRPAPVVVYHLRSEWYFEVKP